MIETGADGIEVDAAVDLAWVRETCGGRVTAIGNVGPGLNLVGPMETYQFVPPVGKLVLMTGMLVGRLELFTMMVVIVPAFWKWR